jgi:hypothetical protein
MSQELEPTEEIAWLLRGQQVAAEVLAEHTPPTSVLESEKMRVVLEQVKSAVENANTQGGLESADPRVRQLVSEGAFYHYNEWATKDLVFSEAGANE